jgi:histidyl-tRNA synthetase
MHDTLPEDAPLWHHIRDAAERVAARFDYHWITTPLVEDQRVFSRTAGEDSDIVAKEMYVFDDRGGDSIALRPEGTAGVVRAYIEHGMASRPQPLRLCYLGPFFRYDRPQAGRYRQLWQFGIELIGDASPAADAEVIDLQRSFYEELGLTDLVLRVNSIGTPEARELYTEALRNHFAPQLDSLSADSQRRFETNVIRILDSKEEADREALESAPAILDYLDDEDRAHFNAVRAYLDALDVSYVVDPGIVRGLDYYTRTVWEFEPAGRGGQSTVGAGGRYDGLVEMLGGPHTPAVGFGSGIERIALNLRDRGFADGIEDAPLDAVTIPLGDAGPAAALKLARSLRVAGLRIRNGTPGRSLKAQLRSAGNSNARYALIIGENEAAEGVVQLKSLAIAGDQQTLSFDSIPAALAADRLRGGVHPEGRKQTR